MNNIYLVWMNFLSIFVCNLKATVLMWLSLFKTKRFYGNVWEAFLEHLKGYLFRIIVTFHWEHVKVVLFVEQSKAVFNFQIIYF